jgi:hypothetical protein
MCDGESKRKLSDQPSDLLLLSHPLRLNSNSMGHVSNRVLLIFPSRHLVLVPSGAVRHVHRLHVREVATPAAALVTETERERERERERVRERERERERVK